MRQLVRQGNRTAGIIGAERAQRIGVHRVGQHRHAGRSGGVEFALGQAQGHEIGGAGLGRGIAGDAIGGIHHVLGGDDQALQLIRCLHLGGRDAGRLQGVVDGIQVRRAAAAAIDRQLQAQRIEIGDGRRIAAVIAGELDDLAPGDGGCIHHALQRGDGERATAVVSSGLQLVEQGRQAVAVDPGQAQRTEIGRLERAADRGILHRVAIRQRRDRGDLHELVHALRQPVELGYAIDLAGTALCMYGAVEEGQPARCSGRDGVRHGHADGLVVAQLRCLCRSTGTVDVSQYLGIAVGDGRELLDAAHTAHIVGGGIVCRAGQIGGRVDVVALDPDCIEEGYLHGFTGNGTQTERLQTFQAQAGAGIADHGIILALSGSANEVGRRGCQCSQFVGDIHALAALRRYRAVEQGQFVGIDLLQRPGAAEGAGQLAHADERIAQRYADGQVLLGLQGRTGGIAALAIGSCQDRVVGRDDHLELGTAINVAPLQLGDGSIDAGQVAAVHRGGPHAAVHAHIVIIGHGRRRVAVAVLGIVHDHQQRFIDAVDQVLQRRHGREAGNAGGMHACQDQFQVAIAAGIDAAHTQGAEVGLPAGAVIVTRNRHHTGRRLCGQLQQLVDGLADLFDLGHGIDLGTRLALENVIGELEPRVLFGGTARAHRQARQMRADGAELGKRRIAAGGGIGHLVQVARHASVRRFGFVGFGQDAGIGIDHGLQLGRTGQLGIVGPIEGIGHGLGHSGIGEVDAGRLQGRQRIAELIRSRSVADHAVSQVADLDQHIDAGLQVADLGCRCRRESIDHALHVRHQQRLYRRISGGQAGHTEFDQHIGRDGLGSGAGRPIGRRCAVSSGHDEVIGLGDRRQFGRRIHLRGTNGDGLQHGIEGLQGQFRARMRHVDRQVQADAAQVGRRRCRCLGHAVGIGLDLQLRFARIVGQGLQLEAAGREQTRQGAAVIRAGGDGGEHRREGMRIQPGDAGTGQFSLGHQCIADATLGLSDQVMCRGRHLG